MDRHISFSDIAGHLSEMAPGYAIQSWLRDYKISVAAYCCVSTDMEEQLRSYEAQKDYYTTKIMKNFN